MTAWITRFDPSRAGLLRVAVKDAIDMAGALGTIIVGELWRARPTLLDAAGVGAYVNDGLLQLVGPPHGEGLLCATTLAVERALEPG